MRLIKIGYWYSDQDPSAWIDRSWNEDERLATASYVLSGTAIRHCMGFSTCRICGVRNGNAEFTDGTYVWPEGLYHYLDAHQVRLPPDFVGHALAQIARFEDAESDETWWRAQRSAEVAAIAADVDDRRSPDQGNRTTLGDAAAELGVDLDDL